MIEYVDEEVRRRELVKLNGIETKIWMQCGASAPIYAIADEDLERSDGTKTSAVHFLRFNITEKVRNSILSKDQISFGVEHPQYQVDNTIVSEETAESLAKDLG